MGGCLAGWLSACRADCLAGGLPGCLAAWLTGCLQILYLLGSDPRGPVPAEAGHMDPNRDGHVYVYIFMSIYMVLGSLTSRYKAMRIVAILLTGRAF